MSTNQEHPVVVSLGASGLATRVQVGGHVLHADEPIDVGGTDTGPTPYDFLLTALGTCTAMTLRMYADRKGWPLTGVVVKLQHERLHAADCEACETTTGYILQITKQLELEGDLSDEQQARLREIADKCPVHRTLTSEIRIVS